MTLSVAPPSRTGLAAHVYESMNNVLYSKKVVAYTSIKGPI